MRAGELDRRVTIEQNSPTQNGYGEQLDSWSTLATVWAAVRPVRGREYFDAAHVQAEVDTEFRIRWRSDVTTGMRISYGGNTYDVHAVLEIGRQEGLSLAAKAQL